MTLNKYSMALNNHSMTLNRRSMTLNNLFAYKSDVLNTDTARIYQHRQLL